MYLIYRSTATGLEVTDTFEPGCWINVVAPSEEELLILRKKLGVHEDYLSAALDEDEAARFDSEDSQSLVVVDVPHKSDLDTAYYETVPFAIIMMKSYIVTVSLMDLPFLRKFTEHRIKGFYTQFKTRFVLQLLYEASSQYLHNLRILEKITSSVETKMLKAQRNDDLIDMLKVEKSLVYFQTSLRGNQSVLDRLLRAEHIKNYPDDQDLLEDVIIENKQAIEMANLYFNILTGTMDAYASMISNNQNDVIKILTVVTMLMAIPTIISGFFGMNVAVPLDEYGDYAFWAIIAVTVVIGLVVAWLLRKLRML